MSITQDSSTQQGTKAFLLSSKNAFEYLLENHICSIEQQAGANFELKPAKNFNLLLTWPNDETAPHPPLLVKQEPRNREGKPAGEFAHEWQMQELLAEFPQLHSLRDRISQAIFFDSNNAIIIFNYLPDYRDLMDFYMNETKIKAVKFPAKIGAEIGHTIAQIHRLTFEKTQYQDFFVQKWGESSIQTPIHLVGKVDRIGPEVFGAVPADGLKFFALYQRFDSLGQAIEDLLRGYQPCCLTHNDLKLNNILLPLDWQETTPKLRLIDWERSNWGDPAFDLGMVIASYLQLWLGSLITSKTMSIEDSLRMATTPLELLQPSIAAIVIAYFSEFPEILSHRPSFLQEVVQFAGFALIQSIHATLQYQKSFGNMGICMLQVAKSLLCRPEAAMMTIFGMTPEELMS